MTMTQNTKHPSPHPPRSSLDDLDLPPSYELATDFTAAPAEYDDTQGSSTGGSASASASASAQSSTQRVIPKNLEYLFSSPSNAEPLLGRDHIPSDQISRIEWRKRGKWIETWDPKLADPDVLYDFLRAMAMTPPKLKIRCFGAHIVTHERDETVYDTDGTPKIKRRGQTEQVIDFDFTIDLSSIIDHPENTTHVHLSGPAAYGPTYRNSHHPTYAANFSPPALHGPSHRQAARRGYLNLSSSDAEETEAQYSPTAAGRRATREEGKLFDEYNTWRLQKGIPRWIKMENCAAFWEQRGKGKTVPPSQRSQPGAIALTDQNEMRDVERQVDVDSGSRAGNDRVMSGVIDVGQPELREWCRAFCADPGILKSFYMFQSVWGWDREGVTAAIKAAILSTGYQSNYLNISFDEDTLGVAVRPNNTFSKLLGGPYPYIFSWITLLFPLIWLWQRLHPRGGAPCTAGRVSYGMKYYPPLPSTYPNETIASAQSRLGGLFKLHPELPQPPKLQLQYGPKGVHYLVGRKEGEWFREWEERIRMGVRMRFKGELEGGNEERAEVDLDGY